jgi:hypothetical protein
MSPAEARFREVEALLDAHLAALTNALAEVQMRDDCARTYHYKNQVLTWCYQFVRDVPADGEVERISVWLTYREPFADRDALEVLVCSEIFQQGKISRVNRRQESQWPIASVKAVGLAAIVTRSFEIGAALLRL